MTACILVMPTHEGKAFPVIISDVVATYPGSDAPIILPANVTAPLAAEVSRVDLYRKSYIVAGVGAFAFSGKSDEIEDCLKEISAQLPAWLLAERPMDRLQDFVNDYKSIRLVGASLDPKTARMNHVWPRASLISRKHLGLTAAVGSGAKALEHTADVMEAHFEGGDRTHVERGITFARHVVNHSLAEEILGREADWGGYFEFVHAHGDGWRRGPPSLHFFLHGTPQGDGTATTSLIGRVIAYDPGEHNGRVLSVSIGAEGNLIKEYILKDILNPPPAPEDGFEFWKSWSPAIVSVSVSVPHGERGYKWMHTEAQADEVIFEIGDGQFTVGIRPEIKDEISNVLLQTVGLKYVA